LEYNFRLIRIGVPHAFIENDRPKFLLPEQRDGLLQSLRHLCALTCTGLNSSGALSSPRRRRRQQNHAPTLCNSLAKTSILRTWTLAVTLTHRFPNWNSLSVRYANRGKRTPSAFGTRSSFQSPVIVLPVACRR